MAETGPLEDFTANREKLKAFIDEHIIKPITDENRDALMGIADEGVRLELEVKRLRALKAQVEMELGEVEALRELRDSVALYIRSGAYGLEQAQGLWHDKPLAVVVLQYLMHERTSVHTILMHRLGRGVW
jgi:hypothetical protein